MRKGRMEGRKKRKTDRLTLVIGTGSRSPSAYVRRLSVCLSVLKTEARESQVLRSVSRLKVRRVRLVVGLWNERHGLVLKIVPVQTRKERVLSQLWKKKKKEEKKPLAQEQDTQ